MPNLNNTPPPYVKEADQDFVRVLGAFPDTQVRLREAGFEVAESSASDLIVRTTSLSQKARLFGQLRDLGIAFSRGREWNPAEVFEWLRNQRLISGGFTEIYWIGPGKWQTRDMQ